jgi:tetratricopeptide (TPR) repeat protein
MAVVRRIESEGWDLIQNQFFFLPAGLLNGEVYALLGEPEKARAEYESALGMLERELGDNPVDERVHSALGLVYAGLGLADLAAEHGERGLALMPYSKEAYKGAFRQEDLARIYALMGDKERAVEAFRSVLGHPSLVSAEFLRSDPRLESLRRNEAFRALLREFAVR